MNHRFDTRLVVCVASFIALAAVACSSAPEPSLSSDQKEVSGGKTPAKTPADNSPQTPNPVGTANPTPTDPAAPAGECAKKADGDACFDCCIAKSPDEYDKVNAVFDDCICVAPGACKADCADTYCGADPSKQPTAACEACITANEATCGAKADTACEASAGCKAVEACGKTECAAFPEKP
jgi:hypothetical protein